MPFVLDNSVVCGWFLESQATPYTVAMAARLHSDRAWVPAVWELELTNVLRTACLRRTMVLNAAHLVIEQVTALPIDIDRKPASLNEIFGLSMRFGLSTYDAAYLELALRLKMPIATADERMREAALAAGVGFVSPDT